MSCLHSGSKIGVMGEDAHPQCLLKLLKHYLLRPVLAIFMSNCCKLSERKEINRENASVLSCCRQAFRAFFNSMIDVGGLIPWYVMSPQASGAEFYM